jgi:uncharacterized membrane protein
MSRPRNNRDNLFVVIGVVLLFVGFKNLMGSEDYSNWFYYGGALIAAGVLDPILALTGKKTEEVKDEINEKE